MIPILYKTTETEFTTQGLGALIDCTRAEVTEEINGEYELELDYPTSGAHYSEIKDGTIVKVKVPAESELQCFRVYASSVTLGDQTTFYARHISYDLSGYYVRGSRQVVYGAEEACKLLVDRAPETYDPDTKVVTGHVLPKGTVIDTDKTETTAAFTVNMPSSVRSWFGGKEGSLIDCFGGEWRYNNYHCTLLKSRGTNKGYEIRYAKNLTEFKNKSDISEDYSAVFGHYTTADGDTQIGSLVETGISTDVHNVLCLDLSEDYIEDPSSMSNIDKWTKEYIKKNGLDKAQNDSTTIDFVDTNLSDSDIAIGDTVRVICLDSDFKTRIIKYTYDVLSERYTSLETGKVEASISDTIHSIEIATEDKTSTREVLKATTEGYIVPCELGTDAFRTTQYWERDAVLRSTKDMKLDLFGHQNDDGTYTYSTFELNVGANNYYNLSANESSYVITSQSAKCDAVYQVLTDRIRLAGNNKVELYANKSTYIVVTESDDQTSETTTETTPGTMLLDADGELTLKSAEKVTISGDTSVDGNLNIASGKSLTIGELDVESAIQTGLSPFGEGKAMKFGAGTCVFVDKGRLECVIDTGLASVDYCSFSISESDSPSDAWPHTTVQATRVSTSTVGTFTAVCACTTSSWSSSSQIAINWIAIGLEKDTST